MRARQCLGIVALGLVAGACSLVTGASGYDDVSHCTGPLCGVCPAGQRFWNDSCLPSCGEGTECGPACCGFGLRCVMGGSGNQWCSLCETAELICGETCCEPGATCVDAEIGLCYSAYGVAKQSCAGGLDCGGGTSCCESPGVPEGSFQQGAVFSDPKAYADEKPERTVTVSSYSLDKYEVTVGRFRKFVEGWDYQPPPAGAGAHPKIAGSGWRSAWNKRLPTDPDNFDTLLGCDVSSTWRVSNGTKESLPINCTTWYEAFAFCAWDGGRLPTEAEWEYAAAGGDENRKYPWEPAKGEPNSSLAVYNCEFGSAGTSGGCYTDDIAPVGSRPDGAGRWGHVDLAGSMLEYVLDVYDEYPKIGSKDYAKTEDIPIRVLRGGSWRNDAGPLRASYRFFGTSSSRGSSGGGFRCARNTTTS